MASGGRPTHSALPQVPGVFPQIAAVHLVAAGDPHHQDRFMLHCFGLHLGGKGASTSKFLFQLLSKNSKKYFHLPCEMTQKNCYSN